MITSETATVSFTLTERQRAAAIKLSGLSGGDGVATMFELLAGGVNDLGLIENKAIPNVTLTEHADILVPTMLNAILDLNLGEIRFRGSEIIAASPAEHLLGSLIAVKNFTSAACFEVFHAFP